MSLSARTSARAVLPTPPIPRRPVMVAPLSKVAQDFVEFFLSANKVLRRCLDPREWWLLVLLDCLSYLIAEMLAYGSNGLDYRPGCASIVDRLSARYCNRSIKLPGENISLDFIGDVGLRTLNRHVLLLDLDRPAAG